MSFLEKDIYFNSTLDIYKKLILADAQTSGGLLISCPHNEVREFINELNQSSKFTSSVIGKFIAKDTSNIYVDNE